MISTHCIKNWQCCRSERSKLLWDFVQIFAGFTENHTERPTRAHAEVKCRSQEENHCSKTQSPTINIQSVTGGVGQHV